MTNYGLIDSSNNLTYYGYAMAQFARFVRPGYARVNATENPQNGVYVSAYSGGGHSAIVVLNMGSSAVSQAFTLENSNVTSLTPYQTTASGGMVAQPSIGVSSGAFTAALPAQSITTFVE